MFQMTFMARLYPTLTHPISPAAIISPPSPTDGTVIDETATFASSSARAAPRPKGDFVPPPSSLSRSSATPGNALPKRATQAPRVLGRFDHTVPPMPPVRFFALLWGPDTMTLSPSSGKPFSPESISCHVMLLL